MVKLISDWLRSVGRSKTRGMVHTNESLVIHSNVKDGHGTGEAVQALAAHFGQKPLELNPTEYVGLVLFDGLSGAEEMINDRIGDVTNVFFVGGSAGDERS